MQYPPRSLQGAIHRTIGGLKLLELVAAAEVDAVLEALATPTDVDSPAFVDLYRWIEEQFAASVRLMKVQGVLETAIDVDDLEAARAFYRDVLKLEVFAAEFPRHVFFRCGQGMLLLFNPDEALKGGEVPAHGARGPHHVCFRVSDAELDEWMEHLQQQGVSIELDLRWPQGGRSLYFRDPAGNSLELASPIIWGMPEE